MKYVWLLALVSAWTLALFVPRSAYAQTPANAQRSVAVALRPALSDTGLFFQGYNEFVVRITNRGSSPARGELRLLSPELGDVDRGSRASAPYAVAPESSAFVRLPLRAVSFVVRLEVLDESGEMIAEQSINPHGTHGVFMVDLSQPSMIRALLHDAPIAPSYQPSSSSGAAQTLMVGAPNIDAATGDTILPERAATWGAADVVLTPSDVLTRLTGAQLEALTGFVLGGGTLAIAVHRPEDLRHETVVAFLGGEATTVEMFPESLEALDGPQAFPGPGGKTIPEARHPMDDVGAGLHGYRGGNLSPSTFGATATYGLGTVHLLAFDPTQRPGADDPWVQHRMVELARQAYDRRATVVFRPGALVTPAMWSSSDDLLLDVRKQLDPNVSARWSIGVAAILLVIYSVLAGPVSFSRAAKRGHPLRALRHLPLWSLGAFILVVIIGVTAKGVNGRSRHLTLVEAGAGMEIGSARRFRGFYTPGSDQLVIHASDSSSMVTLAERGDERDVPDSIRVDRDGTRLVDVEALPWATVVVREDGFSALGEGISIVDDDGTLIVANRSGRSLRAVLLQTPTGEFRYWPQIADGASVEATSGRELGSKAAERDWLHAMSSGTPLGWVDVFGIKAVYLQDIIEDDAPGLADAWIALERAANDEGNWFPSKTAVLLAQLDGGEGQTRDGGMKLDVDRTLVRVVGLGGTP